MRIILIRHGRPAIETAPRTNHHGFRSYIDEYEQAGLDPASAPPEELQDLVKELAAVFTSGSARAHESAKVLAPNAELIADPLFVEAPLAIPAHSAVAHEGSEMGGGRAPSVACGLSSRRSKTIAAARARASEAADILMARAARRRTGGAGGAWLFQRHDRPRHCAFAASGAPAHTACGTGTRSSTNAHRIFGAPLHRLCAV